MQQAVARYPSAQGLQLGQWGCLAQGRKVWMQLETKHAMFQSGLCKKVLVLVS